MKGGLLALGYETVLRQVATDGGRHHEELPGALHGLAVLGPGRRQTARSGPQEDPLRLNHRHSAQADNARRGCPTSV